MATAHQTRTWLAPLLGIGVAAAVGIQALALYAGRPATIDMPWIVAAPVSLVLGTAVLLAWPLVATSIGFASAILLWHWPLLPALALFLPLGITNFMVGGTLGMAWLAKAYWERVNPG